jgi:hypothetical protein
VPVDKEQWSEQSRRGLDYIFAAEHYEDIEFDCYACRAPSVFTAEQQKTLYEVKKAYVWARHKDTARIRMLSKLLESVASADLQSDARP